MCVFGGGAGYKSNSNPGVSAREIRYPGITITCTGSSFHSTAPSLGITRTGLVAVEYPGNVYRVEPYPGTRVPGTQVAVVPAARFGGFDEHVLCLWITVYS